MLPTERTLRYLREAGYDAVNVEQWIPHTHRRRDMVGFIDIVAMNEQALIGVQATSASNVSARVRKIVETESKRARMWLRHGQILVIGWKKLKKRKDGRLWHPVKVDITSETLRRKDDG